MANGTQMNYPLDPNALAQWYMQQYGFNPFAAQGGQGVGIHYGANPLAVQGGQGVGVNVGDLALQDPDAAVMASLNAQQQTYSRPDSELDKIIEQNARQFEQSRSRLAAESEAASNLEEAYPAAGEEGATPSSAARGVAAQPSAAAPEPKKPGEEPTWLGRVDKFLKSRTGKLIGEMIQAYQDPTGKGFDTLSERMAAYDKMKSEEAEKEAARVRQEQDDMILAQTLVDRGIARSIPEALAMLRNKEVLTAAREPLKMTPEQQDIASKQRFADLQKRQLENQAAIMDLVSKKENADLGRMHLSGAYLITEQKLTDALRILSDKNVKATAGVPNIVANLIFGDKAADYHEAINTIKGMQYILGMSVVKGMEGPSVGPQSEKESTAATIAFGSLDARQTREQMIKNLTYLQNFIRKAYDRLANRTTVPLPSELIDSVLSSNKNITTKNYKQHIMAMDFWNQRIGNTNKTYRDWWSSMGTLTTQ